jgi:hypothetical protein
VHTKAGVHTRGDLHSIDFGKLACPGPPQDPLSTLQRTLLQKTIAKGYYETPVLPRVGVEQRRNFFVPDATARICEQ